MTTTSVPPISTPLSLCGRRFAFDAPRFVNDSFKKTADRGRFERSAGRNLGMREHFFFALRDVNRQRKHALDFPDLDGVFRALIEEFDEDFVDAVDRVAQSRQFRLGINSIHNKKPLPAPGKGFDQITVSSKAPLRGGAL